MKDVKGWRLDKELAGGGPLMDVGIYCVQGVRYTTRLEPVAITAKEGTKKDKEKFAEVDSLIQAYRNLMETVYLRLTGIRRLHTTPRYKLLTD